MSDTAVKTATGQLREVFDLAGELRARVLEARRLVDERELSAAGREIGSAVESLVALVEVRKCWLEARRATEMTS